MHSSGAYRNQKSFTLQRILLLFSTTRTFGQWKFIISTDQATSFISSWSAFIFKFPYMYDRTVLMVRCPSQGLYDDEISNTLKARYIEQPKRETTRLVDAWLTVFNVRYGECLSHSRVSQKSERMSLHQLKDQRRDTYGGGNWGRHWRTKSTGKSPLMRSRIC